MTYKHKANVQKVDDIQMEELCRLSFVFRSIKDHSVMPINPLTNLFVVQDKLKRDEASWFQAIDNQKTREQKEGTEEKFWDKLVWLWKILPDFLRLKKNHNNEKRGSGDSYAVDSSNTDGDSNSDDDGDSSEDNRNPLAQPSLPSHRRYSNNGDSDSSNTNVDSSSEEVRSGLVSFLFRLLDYSY